MDNEKVFAMSFTKVYPMLITKAERKGRTGIKMTKAEKEKEIARLEKQMKEAARMMEYEYAAVLRDQIIELRGNGLK